MGAGCHKDVSWFRSEFFLSLFNECGTPLQQVAAHEVEHITIGYGICVAAWSRILRSVGVTISVSSDMEEM